MKHYQIYLFDFDYTLADSSAGIVMCFRNVLNQHGYMNISDDMIKRTIGKTLEDSFSDLTGVTNTQTLTAYKNEYINEANIHMTANTLLFPETRTVLNRLKSMGSKIGIVSTKYRYTIVELLEKEFPPCFFDIIMGCEDVSAPKPSPEGVFYALQHLNGETKNTLYSGDSTIDAQVAQAAGTDFLGVLHGMTTYEELAAYPHVRIADDLNVLTEDQTSLN